MKPSHPELKAALLAEIQQDLDAGRFGMICSNETTFKRYVGDMLSGAMDRATRSLAEVCMPPELGSQNYSELSEPQISERNKVRAETQKRIQTYLGGV